MSKRHGDPSYEDLIAQGYLTPAVLNYVALLGWSPKGALAEQEIFSLKQLVDAFDIAGISKSPAIFDIAKLDYFNATYLRALPGEEFARVAMRFCSFVEINNSSRKILRLGGASIPIRTRSQSVLIIVIRISSPT